jgi:predicted RNA-binding protein YlxR (DUF448 family)
MMSSNPLRKAEKHEPLRMCLGCRERLPKPELIQLQLTRDRKVVIVEHREQRQPGRSVYFCPKAGCLDKVLKKGAITFKRSKYDKIIVHVEPRQAARLRFAFLHAARRKRKQLGVGP